jgi:hypothetical protein
MIKRKPFVGVSMMSIDGFNTLSTHDAVKELRSYANTLLREYMAVDREIARLLRTEVERNNDQEDDGA